jgi:hypothetical protein
MSNIQTDRVVLTYLFKKKKKKRKHEIEREVKKEKGQAMAVHACNPRIPEAEAGRSL